ncbi:nucleotidyltransferase domain-containing protein [bacterium]|nr:nucleotidyltransferase domain-containing protein [bacterium]
MDEKILGLVRRVKDFLVARYGNRIRQVILYGSCARGEQTEHSDVDILVVVDDSLKPFEVRGALGDLIVDILLEEDKLLSVMVLT